MKERKSDSKHLSNVVLCVLVHMHRSLLKCLFPCCQDQSLLASHICWGPVCRYFNQIHTVPNPLLFPFPLQGPISSETTISGNAIISTSWNKRLSISILRKGLLFQLLLDIINKRKLSPYVLKRVQSVHSLHKVYNVDAYQITNQFLKSRDGIDLQGHASI